jgi:hypothetical protein
MPPDAPPLVPAMPGAPVELPPAPPVARLPECCDVSPFMQAVCSGSERPAHCWLTELPTLELCVANGPLEHAVTASARSAAAIGLVMEDLL